MPRPQVIVVGSLNIDYLAAVKRLPRAGETVAATSLTRRFGGKGANQAIAAARQGARVTVLGCVGSDDVGRAYRARLRDNGIDVAGIGTSSRAPTGTALIAVDRAGENTIVVASGANAGLRPAALRLHQQRIARANILLVQWEIPPDTVLAAIRLANRARVPVVMNPSPLRRGFPWGTCIIDVLVANAEEARALFGLRVAGLRSRITGWRQQLERKGVRHLLVTRGRQPTICLSASDLFEVPTLPVKPVDTVGAGDTFAGVLAARLAEGTAIPQAVRYANCAAALATLKIGAQEAIPTRAATERATNWHR